MKNGKRLACELLSEDHSCVVTEGAHPERHVLSVEAAREALEMIRGNAVGAVNVPLLTYCQVLGE